MAMSATGPGGGTDSSSLYGEYCAGSSSKELLNQININLM